MLFATFYQRSLAFKVLLAIAITALAIFITLYYHFLQDPTFHQNAYAILTAFVLVRSMVLQELHLRPHFRGKALKDTAATKSGMSLAEASKEEYRQDERDRAILKKMWTLVGVGMTMFLGGFAIWTLDNECCSRLRGLRHRIGLPFGILLEGHG